MTKPTKTDMILTTLSAPRSRPRRLRRTEAIRSMVRETTVTPADLILPLFVVPDDRPRMEIPSMPGVYQDRVAEIVDQCARAYDLGIPAVLLFGIPSTKDEIGSSSWDPAGPVQSAIRSISKIVPDLTIIADVCLCEYTSHGHCGVIVDRDGRKEIDNDPTLELLVRQAVSFAEAGAHVVAPSDMMDGRVGAIRDGLDESGLTDTSIISYAAKYASAFYGPFRDAAESAPKFGDRRSYQMDPPNWREAMREIALDIEEGADMVMVKPALPYLDIIRLTRDNFDLPVVAYNVSGEYSMVKAAAEKGWVDGDRVRDEVLTSIKRAGADLIITYFASEFAEAYRK